MQPLLRCVWGQGSGLAPPVGAWPLWCGVGGQGSGLANPPVGAWPLWCVWGRRSGLAPPPSGRVAGHLPAPQTGSCERGFSMPAPQRADLQWTAAHCHTAKTAQRRRPSWAALIPGTTDEVAVVLPCWKVMM